MRIGERIALDSPANASKLIKLIRRKVETLAFYPQLGHPAGSPGQRQLLVHTHYLVHYQANPLEVWVLRVTHSARKLN
jgi:plasmid stabilization system protein ParE